ncbi:hypothetical protein FNV43_RR06757 [Rhamnella rubrinervis]|uniref:Reverse transcriptase n=1 Tax=Rhamnella rubrinervis TaxID=2594499 RepID=A0A8K0MM31_9ROSA|nr:hypothetical protein FNV43_RR06757 [Rhamnella rubrinervis]
MARRTSRAVRERGDIASSAGEEGDLWTKIWESKLDERLKIFPWRLLAGVFPLPKNLGENRNEKNHHGKRRFEDFVRLLNDGVANFMKVLDGLLGKRNKEEAKEIWEPPSINWLKANIDAASKEGLATFAFVLRDEYGAVIHLETKLLSASSLEADRIQSFSLGGWDTRYMTFGYRRTLLSKEWKLTWNAGSSNILTDIIAKWSLSCNSSFLFSSGDDFISITPNCLSAIIRQDKAEADLLL